MDIAAVLSEDMELIKEQLEEISGYDFAAHIAMRQQELRLSQEKLAARCGVARPSIGKYLGSLAKPHGKESFKELGMGLGMDETELNHFLLANGYPKLYAKNPLDLACRFVMAHYSNPESIVEGYREFLRVEKLDLMRLRPATERISTGAMSGVFAGVTSAEGFAAFLTRYGKDMEAHDKFYIPSKDMVDFVRIYLGDQSIHDAYVTRELPVTIKNLLYPLLAGKEVAVRHLRGKLIAFGLYEDMAEDEIDFMLLSAKLLPLSEPQTRADRVLLTALRCAHERHPYFELRNATYALARLRETGPIELQAFYEAKRRRAAEFVEYYEKPGHKNGADQIFEQSYTDFAGKGIAHYIRDILTLSEERDILTRLEITEYLTLLRIDAEE
ncbi:hypothetical protein AGMMS49983_10170 [Clostridia bacterium]|nr:hypothetical protein AGMMS49983_10170 [Clostridia bacterium]